ncbi:hypothetical protein C6500_06025 [Candidatus Poribacteria bacterium]|nr:MAG: hypothetical protein C6500_06025 [Candidatus Poribacteria bacterium]
MAKTYDDYLESPEFKKAKFMVQEGKRGKGGKAAYIALSMMNLDKHEKNEDLYPHINDRKLAKMLGIGKTAVFNARDRLKGEKWGIEKVVEKVDASKAKVIGKGGESVYLYYFPAYKLNSIYYIKYIDDSHETPIYPCNIGKTIGDVKDRVSDQTGQQLPEKPRIALVIKTDDCDSLETEIHYELKSRKKWLDPAFESVVGREWFLTNPVEVEGIVKSIDEKRKKEKTEKLEKAKQLLNALGINDPSETQVDTALEVLYSTKNSDE